MKRIAGVLVIAAIVVTAAAAAGAPQELPKVANDNVPARPLRPGTTFQASLFPLPLRITTPDGSWLGGQWKMVTQKRGSFGYLEFQQPPAAQPLGALWMIGSYDPTASVAATVAQLHQGVGATYEATGPVKLAGFPGSRFDGRVTGEHHVFVPFTPLTHAATFHPDAYRFDRGEVFRVVVLDVRGKTVVLLFENALLPAEQFPAFLAGAGRLLKTLQFPG